MSLRLTRAPVIQRRFSFKAAYMLGEDAAGLEPREEVRRRLRPRMIRA